jgi:hypothetical protein
MNWFKENPVVLVIAVVALLGTAVGGFFAMEAAAREEQAVSDLNSTISNLRRLQGKQPFPNEANFKKVEASVGAYKASIEDFASALSKMEVPTEAITPQKFQDNLRIAADNLRKATANKTSLPENFFFGFDEYRTQLPPQGETNELNREFLAIKNLIEAIVPLGITSIDTLVRHPAVKKAAPDPKAAPAKPAETLPAPVSFDSFTLGITATQNAFISAFDKIPSSPGFLVVRSMTIENSSPNAPLKAEVGNPDFSSPADPMPPGAKESLPMLFGAELVKATVVFEIPDFPEKKAEEKPTQPQAQPAQKK